MMRVLAGARLGVFGAGLNASSVGAVLALGYLSLRYPSARKAVTNPELNDVVYDVPHWMLGVGVGLFSLGLLCIFAAWYASPIWQAGPLHRLWGPTLASFLIAGWLTSVVVAVLGRESAEVRELVVGIVALLLPVAALSWILIRANR